MEDRCDDCGESLGSLDFVAGNVRAIYDEEANAAAETPLHKAQLAMASINQRVKEHTATSSTGLIEQVQGFLSQPLAEQRDWSGVHAFVGHPGAGKSTAIARLMQQTLQADNNANLLVISMQN